MVNRIRKHPNCTPGDVKQGCILDTMFFTSIHWVSFCDVVSKRVFKGNAKKSSKSTAIFGD